MSTPRVLVIAGSDSSGGAGIQADIKTITMLGGHAMTAITAVTAQDTMSVKAVYPLTGEQVLEQMAACIEDIGIDAVKIGMLGSGDIVRHVVGGLVAAPEIAARSALGRSRKPLPPGLRPIPIVLDPVMVSTSNDILSNSATISEMVSRLFPVATLLTPNIPELEVLAEGKIRNLYDVREAALRIATRHQVPVLAKGGHSQAETVIDLLVQPDGHTLKFEAARIKSPHTHGTGCTLASAIACGLGRGLELVDAISRAREFVRAAILAAPGFGQGHGPLGQQAVR